MFGRRLLCLWGQFVGTYSTLAYAAYAGWRGRERLVRCGFATGVRGGRSVAWACPVRAYAVALIKVLRGLGAAISSLLLGSSGFLRGQVVGVTGNGDHGVSGHCYAVASPIRLSQYCAATSTRLRASSFS